MLEVNLGDVFFGRQFHSLKTRVMVDLEDVLPAVFGNENVNATDRHTNCF